MLMLAEQYPGLKRGLWWLLAVSVVRHHHGFGRMNLACVYQASKTRLFFAKRFASFSINAALLLLLNIRTCKYVLLSFCS